jgi:hypothetical protein
LEIKGPPLLAIWAFNNLATEVFGMKLFMKMVILLEENIWMEGLGIINLNLG